MNEKHSNLKENLDKHNQIPDNNNNEFQEKIQTVLPNFISKQNNKIFFVIGILILLFILGISGYLLFFKSSPQTTKQDLQRQPVVKAEDKVLQAYKLIEKAVQTGDSNIFLSLYDQKTLNAMGTSSEAFYQKYLQPKPYISYTSETIVVYSKQAAVFGKMINAQDNTSQFYSVRFIIQNNDWKIAEQLLTDTPVDKHIFLPPNESSFIRAGLPWDEVSYATLNTTSFTKDELNWNMQAIMDETFLFIRLTSEIPLPLIGTEIDSVGKQISEIRTGAPQDPSSFVLDIQAKNSTVEQFSLLVGDVMTTKATFDESGKATSNRYFVDYSLVVEDNNHSFHKFASDGTQLLMVDSKYINIRLPIQSLNMADLNSIQGVEIREYNSFAKILPYQVYFFTPSE